MSSERLHVIIRLPWTRPEGFVEPVQSDEFSPEPISFLRQSVRYRREGPHSENVEKPGVPLKEPVQQAGVLEPLKSEDAKRSDGRLGGNSRGRRDDEDVGEGTTEERGGTARGGTTELRTRRRSRTGFRSKVRSSGSAEMTSPSSDTSTFPRPGHGSLSSEPKSSETPTSDHPTRNNPFSLEYHPYRDGTEEIRGESSANAGKYDPSNRPRRTSRSSSEETVSSPSSTTSFHSAFSTTTATENKTVDPRSSRHGRERVPWETRSPTTRIQHTSTLLPPSDMNETVDEPFPRAATVAMRGFVPGRSLVNSSDEEDGDEKDEDQDEEEVVVEDDEENEHNRYDTGSLLLSGGSPVHGIHPETTDLQIHGSKTRSSRALSRRLSRLATMDEPAFLPPPTNGSESTTTTTTTTTLPTTGERTDPLRSSPNKIIPKPRSSRIPPQLLSSAYFQDSFDTTVIRTPILTRPLQNISPPPSPETSSPSSPSFRHRRRRKPNFEAAADLSPSESPPVTGSLIDDTDEEISDSSVTQSAMEEAYLSGLSKASSVSNA